jgi:peptidoglycan/xylan/chitin deacetylase (PgdA/CDA1 family)
MELKRAFAILVCVLVVANWFSFKALFLDASPAHADAEGPGVSEINPVKGTTVDNALLAIITGTGFISGDNLTVELNNDGASPIPGTSVNWVSDTQITCTFDLSGVTSHLGGKWDVKVTNPDSQTATGDDLFTIYRPNPTISSITPNSGVITGPVNITNLSGGNFVNGQTSVKLTMSGQTDISGTGVSVNGTTRITCSFDLSGRAAGDWSVIVSVTGTENSATLTEGFSVNNPIPVTTGISPKSANVGSPQVILTVNGSNFLESSVVRFNGADKSTTFVSSSELTVDIPGSALTDAGSYPITVFNPEPGGGISNAQTFAIYEPQPVVNQGAMITFRFDDAHITQYNTAMPILQNAGFVGTAYMITNELNGDPPNYMNWTQAREMYNNGWEIGSHTISHPQLTTLSDSQLVEEIGGSYMLFESHGIPVKSFSSPHGGFNNHVLSYVAKYYESHSSAGDNTLNIFPFDDYRVSVREITSTTSVATVESWVDEAASSGEWLVLLMHVLTNSPSNSWDYTPAGFQTIVNYVKAISVPVVTVSDGLKILNQNLVSNPSFETGTSWADGWTRSSTSSLVLDTGNNGCAPNATKSLKIIGGSSSLSAYSSLIPVNPARTYIQKAFVSRENSGSGSLNISIAEYDLNGNPISKKTQSSLQSEFVGYMNSVYTPSANAANVRLFIEAAAGSSFTAYIDNIVLADSSSTTTPNNKPILNEQIPNQSFNEDSSLPNAIDLNNYFSDPDGTALTYSALGNTNVIVTIINGVVSFSAAANWHGVENVTFIASDGSLTAQDTIAVTVDNVNDAPVASNKTATTGMNTPVSISITATDVDGDALTYSITAQPVHGTLSGTAPALTYTPAANYSGTDTFTYRATDGQASSTATVTITITQLSTNADLSGLTISAGTLTPAFASGTTSYTDSVANAVTSVTVTPTVSDSQATVKVNNTSVASGQASQAINLNVGANTVTIVVTAQDGITTKTYAVVISRDLPLLTMEPIAELEGQYYKTAPVLSNFGFDADSGLDDGWYQMDSYIGGWTSLFTNDNNTDWDQDNWIIPGFASLSQGTHTIYFKATDDSANQKGESGEWKWQFNKDTLAPTNPNALTSPSHMIGKWSDNTTITVTWIDSLDAASGLDGYSLIWDNTPSTLPDTTKDIEQGIRTATSPALADAASYYFHIRAVDNTGNWQANAMHLGPFIISVNTPILSEGMVSPTSGTKATQYKFTIAYTDPNNQPPSFVRIGIDNNTLVNMTLRNGQDGEFINGKIYEYTASTLENGLHSYRFSASDGTNSAIGDIHAHTGLKVGAASSGGGGGGRLTMRVSLDGLVSATPLEVNSQGVIQSAAQLKTKDGKVILDFTNSTKLLTSDNTILSSLTAGILDSPPAPMPGHSIIAAYTLEPDGATFDPALKLTLSYDPLKLPSGVTEEDLFIAYFDGTQWRKIETTVDPLTQTAIAKASHLSDYALIGKVNSLQVLTTPTPSETPTSAPSLPSFSNTVPVQTETPTSLAAVPPITTPTTAAHVTVFDTKTEATPTSTPSSSEASGTPWSLIVGIIVGAMIFLLVVVLLKNKKGPGIH